MISSPPSLGVHAVPVVQNALASRHDGLQCFVVMNVVAKWPAEAIAPLKVQLQAVATGSGFYGTDLVALRLLTEPRLDRTRSRGLRPPRPHLRGPALSLGGQVTNDSTHPGRD